MTIQSAGIPCASLASPANSNPDYSLQWQQAFFGPDATCPFVDVSFLLLILSNSSHTDMKLTSCKGRSKVASMCHPTALDHNYIRFITSMFQSSRDTTQHEDYESLLSNDQKQSSQRTRTSHPRLRRLALAVIAIACIYTISNIAPSHLPRIKSDRYQEVLAERVELPHIYDGVQTTNAVNSTLGFQKIYALNLPHRLDKKDELTLMGHASDIKIDFLTTQLVADLKDVGLPHHGPVAYPGVIGCWRAHADAWQRIVSNRITSSLIIEDDNDWDVDIK
jgi:hypothetical protein